MRRRPYRQAIPLHELREDEKRRVRNRELRFRVFVVGGALSVLAGAAIVVVSLLSAFGQANAGGASPTPISAARVPGSTTDRTGQLAGSAEQPLPSSIGTAVNPPVSSPMPLPTDGSGTPSPIPSPTPTPTLGATSLEPEQLTGYRWPLRGARVSSFFENRVNGFLVVDGKRIHEGVDLATFCGDHVRAAHDGVVLAAGRRFDSVMGFDASLNTFYQRIDRRHALFQLPIVVVIDDGNGYRSAYVHLGVASVKVGDAVQAGDLIGYEGATGNASGCHLHYELFRMDGPWMKVAPALVKSDHYPDNERARIDPFRVLSMKQPGHPTFMSGIDPPAISPGLGRPTVQRKP